MSHKGVSARVGPKAFGASFTPSGRRLVANAAGIRYTKQIKSNPRPLRLAFFANLAATVLTFGLWLPVWIFLEWKASRRKKGAK